MNNKIQLTQSPIIKHSLEQMGLSVTNRISELKIDKLVATEDTISTLKKLRAELNKEAKEFESQRKVIKDAVLTPYNDFETIYKEQIITKYKEADETLKSKVNDFEMKIKTDRKIELEEYFAEICDMEQIDWLTFSRFGIEINLSTTLKKYKEQVLEKIQTVVNDLELINTDTYATEMLVEYKTNLNVSQAIKTVRDRKANEKAEAVRLQMQVTSKRTAQLRSIGLVYHDITRTYNWVNDESVMIKNSDVEMLSDIDWTKKYGEIESIVKKSIQVGTPTSLRAPTIRIEQHSKKEEVKPEVFEAKFSLSDTYERLMQLSKFLKDNGYNYKNID